MNEVPREIAVKFETQRLLVAADELSFAAQRPEFSVADVSYVAVRLTRIKESVARLEELLNPPCTNHCECRDCKEARRLLAESNSGFDFTDEDDV